jgi:putative tryptophan/tyrosine transport system substrate-binding protein
VRRRDIIAVFAGLSLLRPCTARAQQTKRAWRIGFLGDGPRSERGPISLAPFVDGLRELGYAIGADILIEERWSEGDSARLGSLAAELIGLQVDVIVTHGIPAVTAAHAATQTIPIVVGAAPDLVTTGFAASLARPGGNVTGLTDQVIEFAEKEIQVLRDALPQLRRVSILWNGANPGAALTFEATRRAAEKAGLEIATVGITSREQIESGMAQAARGRPDGLVVIHDTLTTGYRRQVAAAALKYGLPSICASSPFVEAGGLIAYAPNLPALFKRAATFVDRILRGARPADLPIEQPTRFELRINLRTAKALGITLPPTLLAWADEVIE